MKKILSLFILVIILLPVFCETAEASLNMLAYKDVYIVVPENTSVSVKYNNAAINPGQEFNITSAMTTTGNNLKLSNAFSITVATNRKNPVSIELAFSPLVNKQNRQTTVPISYTITSTSDATESSPYAGEQTELSSETTLVIFVTNTETQFGYIADLSLSDSASSISVSAANEWTERVLVYRVTGVKSRSRSSLWTQPSGNYGSWSNSDMPEKEGEALPYLGPSQRITTTATFDFIVSQSEFNNLIANQDYSATVRMTVLVD